MKNLKLQLSTSFIQILGLTFLFLVFIIGFIEILFRFQAFNPYFQRLVPSLGGRHHQFEVQVARLERFREVKGSVDCIVFGSSLVWLGFDPDAFEEAYGIETGQDIRCFNFGVETLPASAAGVLAGILINDYQPKTLIYGTSARDYSIDIEAEDAKVILNTPWVQYKNGHRSISGWAFTHSYLIRYHKNFQKLLRLDSTVLQEIGINSNDFKGFLAKNGVAGDYHLAVAKADARRWLNLYEIHPENISGLEQVINQYQNGTKVIVVEMPVQDSYMGQFGNGEKDYQRFVDVVSRLSTEQGMPFWQTKSLKIVPDDGWWDKTHLNRVGANAFSKWLGRQLGNTVIAEQNSFSLMNQNENGQVH